MHTQSGPERGVAALTLTGLLLLAALLATGYAHRSLLVEQRASANQYRAAQAHAAAEAGLDWALAKLNDTRRIGSDCLPNGAAGATRFRERYLTQDADAARYAATSWDDAGTARALMPMCARHAGAWHCSCPSNGPPEGADDDTATAAFALRIEGDPQAGVARLVAAGCSQLPCSVDAGSANAGARIEIAVALLPALRSAPAAALTVRESIDADAATFGAHNPDPLSGGVALHAGGAIHAHQARLTAPAGAVSAGRMVAHDPALAALDAERYFVSWFGLEAARWLGQPVVQRLACSGDCTAALVRAIDNGAEQIGVDGDLLIQGPVALGSAQHPVVIVTRGTTQLRGAVTLTGVLYAAELGWNDAAAGAWLRGAAISAGGYSGNASADLIYDAAVLTRLMRSSGGFVRVPGSWRDF